MSEYQHLAQQAGAESGAPSPDAVAAFLTQNPDFLHSRPDLINALTPANNDHGEAVVDFQKIMVDRLRGEVDSLRECAQSLIDTSRDNMSHQGRTHSAVITLLSAPDFAQGVRAVMDDLPVILGVDAAAIGFETQLPPRTDMAVDGMRLFDEGAVDRMLGENREVRLLPDASDDGSVFGADAHRIRSCVLVRLHAHDAFGNRLPDGIIALGSALPGTFQVGQGTELVAFLARVLEKCIQQWTRTA